MDKQQRLEFNRRTIAEFRSSGGHIASFGDAPVLLLTTRGPNPASNVRAQ